jgi:hypothetical protein
VLLRHTIQTPMKIIFDRPVSARSTRQFVRIERCGADVVACLDPPRLAVLYAK